MKLRDQALEFWKQLREVLRQLHQELAPERLAGRIDAWAERELRETDE